MIFIGLGIGALVGAACGAFRLYANYKAKKAGQPALEQCDVFTVMEDAASKMCKKLVAPFGPNAAVFISSLLLGFFIGLFLDLIVGMWAAQWLVEHGYKYVIKVYDWAVAQWALFRAKSDQTVSVDEQTVAPTDTPIDSGSVDIAEPLVASGLSDIQQPTGEHSLKNDPIKDGIENIGGVPIMRGESPQIRIEPNVDGTTFSPTVSGMPA